MNHGETKSIAAGEPDFNPFVKYGPVVGAGIFALLSVWALIIIYRAKTGQKEKDDLEMKKKQIAESATEMRAINDNNLTANPVDPSSLNNGSKDESDSARLPADKNNLVDPTVAALEKQDERECLGRLPKPAVDLMEEEAERTNILSIHTEQKGRVSDPQEVSSDLSWHPVLEHHSGSESSCSNGANLDASSNKLLQNDKDTEVTPGEGPSKCPTSRNHTEYEYIGPTPLSRVRNMTSDKKDKLNLKARAHKTFDTKEEASGDRGFRESCERDPSAYPDSFREGFVLPEVVAVEQPGVPSPAGKKVLEESGSCSLQDRACKGVVSVCFRLHYVTGLPSQRLAVTGSLPELGSWHSFVEFHPEPDGFWAGTVVLPALSQAEWKFVVVEGGAVQRWEECANRHLDAAGGGDVVLHKWWGSL